MNRKSIITALAVSALVWFAALQASAQTDKQPITLSSIASTDLGYALDEGSMWTDGFSFYRLITQPGIYRLEGGTLHEGGGLVNIHRSNAGLSVLPYDEESAFTAFGELGDRVEHRRVKSQELLIAVDPASDAVTGVLVRFDGDEMEYEISNMRYVLSGAYLQDNEINWAFYADGTMKMPGASTAKPYQFELCYDMPSNVIALPDGNRYGVELTAAALTLNEATFDPNEDFWVVRENANTEIVALNNGGTAPEAWYLNRVIADSSFSLLSLDYLENLDRYLPTLTDPMARLNAALIRRAIANRTEPDDDGGVG